MICGLISGAYGTSTEGLLVGGLQCALAVCEGMCVPSLGLVYVGVLRVFASAAGVVHDFMWFSGVCADLYSVHLCLLIW